MKYAFEDAGFVTPKERVQRLIADALRGDPENVLRHDRYEDTRERLRVGLLGSDAETIWEFFAPHFNAVAQKELFAAARDLEKAQVLPVKRGAKQSEAATFGMENHKHLVASVTRKPAKTAVPEKAHTPSAGLRAPNPSMVNMHLRLSDKVLESALDRMMINGQKLGDLTSREVRAWAAKRGLESRFLFKLTENLPLDWPVRKFRTPEETNAIYREAEQEAAE